MSTSNTLRYDLSIQTNEDGHSINSFATKREALEQAAYFRTGGAAYRGLYASYENPQVQVYDNVKQESVYTQPMFKYALKDV